MSKRLIRFDWAIKKLLRDKANFDILEGFLSELLDDNIVIQQVLDSESNKDGDAQRGPLSGIWGHKEHHQHQHGQEQAWYHDVGHVEQRLTAQMQAHAHF